MGQGDARGVKRLMAVGLRHLRRIPSLIRREIWQTLPPGERGLRARFFALLRIGTLTIEGILKNRVPSQAAALAYYTLIALGPLLAIVIMVSGFIIQDEGLDGARGEDAGPQEVIIVDALTRLVYFIAPTAEEASKQELANFFDMLDRASSLAEMDPDAPVGAFGEVPAVNPQIVEFLQDLVRNARSGTVGVIGTLILILISIQLLASIESTFNTIWGVSRSRPLAQRVVFYWSFISLGAVLGFAAVTLGTVGALTRLLEDLPIFGNLARAGFVALAPFLGFLLMALLLCFFNRFIPNTHVRWLPALLGALIVALLLRLNQELSFLYIGFVVRQKSLFGAVGILPILLFGLYLFWLILLLGGQLTYAIQNMNSLTNQRSWEGISFRTREYLALATFLLVSRRFQGRQPPCTAAELSDLIRAPGNIINQTLLRLVELGLVVPVEGEGGSSGKAVRYQPGVPLDSLTLIEFKEAFETHGNNAGGEQLVNLDPILECYRDDLLDYHQAETATRSLAEWMRAKTEPKDPG